MGMNLARGACLHDRVSRDDGASPLCDLHGLRALVHSAVRIRGHSGLHHVQRLIKHIHQACGVNIPLEAQFRRLFLSHLISGSFSSRELVNLDATITAIFDSIGPPGVIPGDRHILWHEPSASRLH